MTEELAADLQRSADERLQQTQALLLRAVAGAHKAGLPCADAAAAVAVARASHADMHAALDSVLVQMAERLVAATEQVAALGAEAAALGVALDAARASAEAEADHRLRADAERAALEHRLGLVEEQAHASAVLVAQLGGDKKQLEARLDESKAKNLFRESSIAARLEAQVEALTAEVATSRDALTTQEWYRAELEKKCGELQQDKEALLQIIQNVRRMGTVRFPQKPADLR